jgi:predicted enzyme related to lactoylglutathione lyase
VTGELSFFEIGVGDADKARAFYGALFGWDFSDPPSGKGAMVETPNVPGGIHGGDQGGGIYTFFAVDDLDAAAERVRELGGEAETIPGDGESDENVAKFGRFMLCRDDQGSAFGLHQPPGPR